MRRWIASALVVIASFAALADPSAGTTSKVARSSVIIFDAAPEPEGFLVYGRVFSKRARCVRDRTVRVFAVTDKAKLVDTAHASDTGGGWAAEDDFTNAFSVRAKIRRERVSRHLVCRGWTTALVLP